MAGDYQMVRAGRPPQHVVAEAAEMLWSDLYGKLDRALSNRPLGRGRPAY